MKKIIKQLAIGQPPYFKEEESNRKFRRIVGGMQWPGNNPGALAVVAENLEKDPVLEGRKFRVLSEYESKNVSELMARCEELQEFLKVEKFYGETTNLSMMKMFRQGKFKVRLSKAPFVDDPNVYVTYLNLIREKVLPTKELLHFEEGSALPGILSSLPTKPTDLKSDYPQVAVLGYGLSRLILYPFKKPHPPGVSYKPLDPLVGY